MPGVAPPSRSAAGTAAPPHRARGARRCSPPATSPRAATRWDRAPAAARSRSGARARAGRRRGCRARARHGARPGSRDRPAASARPRPARPPPRPAPRLRPGRAAWPARRRCGAAHGLARRALDETRRQAAPGSEPVAAAHDPLARQLATRDEGQRQRPDAHVAGRRQRGAQRYRARAPPLRSGRGGAGGHARGHGHEGGRVAPWSCASTRRPARGARCERAAAPAIRRAPPPRPRATARRDRRRARRPWPRARRAAATRD